jgi:hypothetical protein
LRSVELYLREFVSVNSDVVELAAEDLDIFSSWGGQGGDDDTGEHNEEFHFDLVGAVRFGRSFLEELRDYYDIMHLPYVAFIVELPKKSTPYLDSLDQTNMQISIPEEPKFVSNDGLQSNNTARRCDNYSHERSVARCGGSYDCLNVIMRKSHPGSRSVVINRQSPTRMSPKP